MDRSLVASPPPLEGENGFRRMSGLLLKLRPVDDPWHKKQVRRRGRRRSARISSTKLVNHFTQPLY
ncbi:hypothetical protein MPLDJ20_140375 [Mesorhizobium plurifarium]|uniref:Uncharacterized protein n=1 Tax=Mesorhizobium plurifarium TaxID=69974 RepID=A0A090GIC5_MESPL|nr:hypothetical protein MPLDJ20_140375 [Mesorhizobium plurifarium]